jgi:CRP/FNR family cyclic AMP-dependent transcriptional regulator
MDASRRNPGQSEMKTVSWPPRTLLGMLSETSRAGLLSLGIFREYAAGATMLLEGDTSRHVIAVHGGWTKVITRTSEGGMALLALLSRGDLIGEMAALDDQPRSASVITAGPVTGYVIQQQDFLRFLAGHPDAYAAVARSLSAKLRWATRRRTDFSGLPGDVRLARILSELARMNGRITNEGTELGYTLTQPELAAMLGVSEPSVQRALRKLRDIGVIDTRRRQIVVLNMTALHVIARDWAGPPA